MMLCKEENGQMLMSNKNNWPDDEEQRRILKEQRITTECKEGATRQ